MRTRFLPKMTNNEVEEYLDRNDLIFVPVGVTELHGALPLDSETVIAEALSKILAEKADGLVLPHLNYFYAGATAIGRGTVQVSVRSGIDYLLEVVRSLKRQGFGRIIFVTLHGPAYLTVGPVLRDFFDETHTPALYLDMSTVFGKVREEWLKDPSNDGKDMSMDFFNDMVIAGYDLLGRLEEVPLTDRPLLDCSAPAPGTTRRFSLLGSNAYQSGSWGHYFADPQDHMPTPFLATAEDRKACAEKGKKIIDLFVKVVNIEQVAVLMNESKTYLKEEVMPKYGQTLQF